ncbi:MAG: phosphotransferase [Phycisphaerae bacterium]
MAVHLQPLWGQEHALQTSSAPAVECRTLGYRAGRRAAIAYRRVAAESPSQGFLGKTFRDRREEKLARTHRELSEQLAWYTQGRVRVPLPRGHLPNLHMTLFSWAGGKRATGKMVTPANGAFAAVDVLAALHRTSLDGVPTFSVEDECGIVEHWHAALERVDPSSAAATKPLLDRLLETAGTLGPTAPCTIHRDFYDRQLIVGRRTTTLLDLDTLARGAPSVDLGNLLAHLFLAALGAERTPAEFEKLAGKLIARYEGQKGPVDRRALAFFWATALFRVGAVHAFRTATHRHAPAMWASAEHVLKTVKMRSSSNARVGRAKGRGRQRLATKGSA